MELVITYFGVTYFFFFPEADHTGGEDDYGSSSQSGPLAEHNLPPYGKSRDIVYNVQYTRPMRWCVGLSTQSFRTLSVVC